MKILLINPTTSLVENSPKLKTFFAPILPTGLAIIAAVLKSAGMDVKIIDQFANKIKNDLLISEIKRYSPDIIGFSCITPVMNNVKMLVKEIRKFSSSPIILGGIHPTIFSEELLKNGTADCIVRGEGEITTLELAKALMAKSSLHKVNGINFLENGRMISTPNRLPVDDLDTLPYPAWDLFQLQYYREVPLAIIYNELALPVLGSRGCPFRCMFCAQDKIYPKPRYRKYDEIIKEMEYMHSRYGARNFGFIDANFPFDAESGVKFCKDMIKSGLSKRVRWVTETRVDLVNEELFFLMKKSGLHLIMFGFETGNQKVLDSTSKQTTVKRAKEVMLMAKKARVHTLGLFMLGLPGETRENCLETIKLAKELDCDISKFNIAVPYPGSKFFEQVYKEKSDIVDPERFTGWYDWSDNSEELVHVPEGMTSKELLGLQRKGMFEFYMRPRVILRLLWAHRHSDFRKLVFGAYVLASKYAAYLSEKLKAVGKRAHPK